jgi:hypothetical protein
VAVKETNASRIAEMQEILRLAAEPYRSHDNAKSRLARAASALQIPWRRAYSLWYGEAKTLVRDEEAARLRTERDRLLRLHLERLEQETVRLRRRIDEADLREKGRRDVAKAGAAGNMAHRAVTAAGQVAAG